MNFFHHKDLGNHLLQLCPKVVKHTVYTVILPFFRLFIFFFLCIRFPFCVLLFHPSRVSIPFSHSIRPILFTLVSFHLHSIIHSFSFSSYRTFYFSISLSLSLSLSLCVSMLHQFIRYEFQRSCFPGICHSLCRTKKRHVLACTHCVVPRRLICIPPPSCARVISHWSTSSTGCVHEL